jgi:type IV secretion system protein VirB5
LPVKVKAQGSGIPTFDAANYAQALEEIARMQELIAKTEEEIATLNNQLNAITGPRGMGDLLNDLSQQEIRRYTPANWQQTLGILNAGGNPGSLADLKNTYEQNAALFDHIENTDIDPNDPDSANASIFGYARDTTLGSLALSETSFNRNDQRIANYENLINQIDSAADTKAAADLANRIMIENGLTASELIRLQATQIQLNAARTNQILGQESQNNRFFQFDPDFTPEPVTPP